MIFEWMIFGSAAFWVFASIAAAITLLVTSAWEPRERGVPSFWAFLIFGVGFVCVTDLPEFTLMNAAFAALAYVSIGLVWTTLRWFFFLRRVRSFAIENAHLGRGKLATEMARNWIGDPSLPPKPRNNKGRIWFWSWFWPVDAILLVLDRPLFWLYSNVIQIFTAMSNRMFEGVVIPDDNVRAEK